MKRISITHIKKLSLVPPNNVIQMKCHPQQVNVALSTNLRAEDDATNNYRKVQYRLS